MIHRNERCQLGGCRKPAKGRLHNPDGPNPRGLRCDECGEKDAAEIAAIEPGWSYQREEVQP